MEKQLKELKVSEEERSRIREATKFGIFVVHNKYVASLLKRTRLGSIRWRLWLLGQVMPG